MFRQRLKPTVSKGAPANCAILNRRKGIRGIFSKIYTIAINCAWDEEKSDVKYAHKEFIWICVWRITDRNFFWLWSYQYRLNRPKGTGWWQKCWIIFHTKTLCFLQGLCYSVQIWAGISKMTRLWNCSSHTCWGQCLPAGCWQKWQKRFNIILKEWQGTPAHPQNLDLFFPW